MKAPGIGVRPPGAWGRRPPSKPANENGVTTGSDTAKPANSVNPKPENLPSRVKAKPANAGEVTTGFGVELSASEPQTPPRVRSTSLCEPFREAIEPGLSQDRTRHSGRTWSPTSTIPPQSQHFGSSLSYGFCAKMRSMEAAPGPAISSVNNAPR
jgi:hypothetical protein